VKPEPLYQDPPPKVLRKLSVTEQKQVARRKAEVIEHLPDMAPFFNELNEAGMMDGWRGVGEVELHPSTCSGRTDLKMEGNGYGTA